MRHAATGVGQAPTTSRATRMREEFDSAFSRLPQRPGSELADLLELRLGDQRCLLRLAEVVEVIARPRLTAVPSPTAALLGLTGSRGSVIAVYDLARLTGRDPGSPHWLVIPAASPSIGLAFEHFEGHRRIPQHHPDAVLVIEMATILAAVQSLNPFPHQRSGAR